MVTDALLTFALSLVRAIAGLLPEWQPDAEPFTTTSTSLGSMAAVGNGYFPVTLLGICLAVVIGLKVALLAWRAVVFVYELIPFKAS